MNDCCDPATLAAIRPALVAVAGPVTQAGPARHWRFALLNSVAHEVTAQVMEGFLAMEALASTANGGDAPRLWEVLTWNTTLPGLAKFALDGHASLWLRGDIPLEDETDIPRQIRETCHGFQAGWERLGGMPCKTPAETNDGPPFVDLKRLCTEAGWPCAERGPEKVAVNLETARGSYTGLVQQTRRGTEVFVELLDGEGLTPLCREALALTLLSANAIVRLARTVVVDAADHTLARWEVVFGGEPCAAELATALSSLSVGCDLLGEEVRALQEEEIAREFLAMRGLAPLAEVTANKQQHDEEEHT